MNTNVINVLTVCVIFVIITFASVNCDKNDNIQLLKPGFGKANSYWFAKTENAKVTVSDISQIPAVSPYQREPNLTVNKVCQNETIPTDRSKSRFLNTTQLAEKNGYEVQEHTLTTKDGYILTIFQLVGKGPVVFLMHGLLGSSDDFVVSGPGKALAYLLADAGYNVWLGNARGNKYSRDHEYLDPDSRPFWEFSWHEIGVFDLPTMVDHALLVSNTDQLTYIGHGQGTTVFFVLTSEKPGYNKKFNLMISLGTTAWTWHIKSPVLQALIPLPDSQFQALEYLGFYEIFPATRSSKICCSSTLAQTTCIRAIFNIVGFDYDQIDYSNACLKLTHFPSGASLRQLQHYVQLARSREFAQFDFGKQKNLVTYGSPTPPPYDVESITTPIVIFYGDNDWVATLDDTLILVQRLPNVQKIYRVGHTDFNHFDFIYGKDAEQLVYWKILDIISEKFPVIETETACDESNSKCQ